MTDQQRTFEDGWRAGMQFAARRIRLESRNRGYGPGTYLDVLADDIDGFAEEARLVEVDRDA